MRASETLGSHVAAEIDDKANKHRNLIVRLMASSHENRMTIVVTINFADAVLSLDEKSMS